jgi:hypothetical protein
MSLIFFSLARVSDRSLQDIDRRQPAGRAVRRRAMQTRLSDSVVPESSRAADLPVGRHH